MKGEMIFMYNMTENMIKGLELYHRTIISEVEEYDEIGYLEMKVKLKNGDIYIYDDLDHSLRKLPNDYELMTDYEYMTEFAYRLRRQMKIRCMSNKQLAEETGLSPAMITKYTHAQSMPGLVSLRMIIKVLNCDTRDLIF